MVNIIKSKGLEERVLRKMLNGEFDSPKIPTLFFSGNVTENNLKDYLKAHDKIVDSVSTYKKISNNNNLQYSNRNTKEAKIVYNSLENSKFSRYKFYQPRFSNAVLSQSSSDPTEVVGDCRSLSFLLGTVGFDYGIQEIGILYNRDHMCNFILDGQKKFRIENTNSNGFGKDSLVGFTEKPLDFMVPYQLFSIAALNTQTDPKKSIQFSSMALELDKFPDAYISRAISKININKNKSALKDLDFAKRLGREDDELFFYTGKAFRQLKKYNESINFLNLSIEENEFYPNSHLERGILYYETNNFNEAINDLSFEIEKFANYKAFFWRGLSHMKNCQIDLAKKDFEIFKSFENKLKNNYFLWKINKRLGLDDETKKYFFNLMPENFLKKHYIFRKKKVEKISEIETQDDVSDFCDFKY